MTILATLGEKEHRSPYEDRPTVKIVIERNGEVLLLNNGLLPGGGVDKDESQREAIDRELIEELGVTIHDVKPIGTVIQYRTFLQKRYVINGYTATLATEGHESSPQDDGEAAFAQNWMTLDKAIGFVEQSIEVISRNPEYNDSYQGKLYNLKTTHVLLKNLQHQPKESRDLA